MKVTAVRAGVSDTRNAVFQFLKDRFKYKSITINEKHAQGRFVSISVFLP